MVMGDEVVKGPVVVTGASGFIGSWLVMRLLEQGYTVRATVRDPSDDKKVKHLLQLPKAEQLLTLWKADLDVEGSYDEVIEGSKGVFHLATPMDFESSDPENEVIKPTVKGMLDVMRSCKKGGVKRVIFTTSAGTVNVMEHQLPEYDETCWSDLDFINRVKMTGWMYFVSKIFAERAAMDFAEENGLDFISVVPTLVVGPFITPSMPPSLITALAVVTGNESHYSILKQVQLVHLDDLCLSLIFLYEHPETKGRYISSSHDTTIVAISKMLNQRYPEYSIPTKFEGIDNDIAPVCFSSKKLTDMGFKFQYTMEDMYDGAIKSCREKNLITPRKLADHNQDSSVPTSTHIPNGADPCVADVAAI